MSEAARVIPSILKRMRSHRPQLAGMVVLLVGSLVLTSLLAYQGYDAAKGHRQETQERLREWAQRAALDFDERVQTGIHFTLFYVFEPVFAGQSDVRDPHALAAAIAPERMCTCLDRSDARSVFLYDYERRSLRVSGNDFSPEMGELITNGLVHGPSFRVGENTEIGTLTGAPDGVQHVVFFLKRMTPNGAPSIAYGFEIGGEALGRYIDTIWRWQSLLPVSVAQGMPNDWFLSARVVDASGLEWFRSRGRYPDVYTAVHTMDKIVSDLALEIAVRPDAADHLLIGGTPSSRLPTLFFLLALTTGLLVASIVLIGRETEIARLRADFIAGVSHELRTPLAQIRMFAETLMLGRVRGEDEQKRSLEIIDQEARRLTHLVENVLLFARAERRSGRINPERVDLAADVRDAIHGFAILCRSRAVEIRPELQENIGVNVDRGALRQILLNLLDNAVKYGPLAQRITVGMAMFNGTARVWVDDEGAGIPESDRQRVFDSFFRLDRDVASPIAGSGIGLAIVKELVNLHDGRVWIENAPGGGARVVVELPGAYLRSGSARDEWAVA